MLKDDVNIVVNKLAYALGLLRARIFIQLHGGGIHIYCRACIEIFLQPSETGKELN